MAQVLVAGALHYDVIVDAPRMPALDETLPGTAVTYAFGGKGGNQAVAAARHGARTAFVGKVGDDGAGRFLTAVLDAAGIDRAQVATDPDHASGMSVAIVTETGDYGAVILASDSLRPSWSEPGDLVHVRRGAEDARAIAGKLKDKTGE